MKFTADAADQLRLRFAEFRERNRVRPESPLSIDLVLAEMEDSKKVPPSFFKGRTLKTLNNTLWRFSIGKSVKDETLAVISTFLDSAEVERRAEIDWEDEASVVHGLMAIASSGARKAFNAIQDGRYISDNLRFEPDRKIELFFECDRSSMLIRVEEHTLRRDSLIDQSDNLHDRGKRGKQVRKGYGFLATSDHLLHIFLKGDTPHDRCHYVEAPRFLSTGHPKLIRFGSGDKRRNLTSDVDKGYQLGVVHFRSEELLRQEDSGKEIDPALLDTRGPIRNIAWGVLAKPDDATFRAEENLIEAVRDNDVYYLLKALKRNVDVNHRDEFGMTVLHHAASTGARRCLRALVTSNKCNYLIADKWGRYPSDLALEWSRDYAVARLLTRKRLVQATLEGVPARVAKVGQD